MAFTQMYSTVFEDDLFVYVETAAPLSWSEARDLALTVEGNGPRQPGDSHLATITSGTQNAAVHSLRVDTGNIIWSGDPWIGMFRDPPATPDARPTGWQWVTGEPVIYTNWHPFGNQPLSTDQYFVHFYDGGAGWNDNNGAGFFPNNAEPSFVAELDADADNVLTGTPGDDRLTGGAGRDRLDGKDGNDQLDGGTGIDALSGGQGGDRLSGGAGNDDLAGGGGADDLSGGPGTDTLDGGGLDDTLRGDAGDDLLLGGGGKDRIEGGGGTDILRGGNGADDISGGGGKDRLEGERGADRLAGDAGADTLEGGAGKDALSGGDANDLLMGQAGADRLDGGADDDILIGGAGPDILLGGAGADLFRFNAKAGFDTLEDFTFGEDRIEITAGASGRGDLVIEQLSNGTSVTWDATILLIRGADATLVDAEGVFLF